MVILGPNTWVPAVEGAYGDPEEKVEREQLRAEGKLPPRRQMGISADAEAAREKELKHIGLAVAQKKQLEKNPGPRSVNNPAISVIYANLIRMHQSSREQAAKKGHPTTTVPLPNPEELLPPRQQYPMNPPPPPTSNKGGTEATTGKGKGKATDEEEA
ncbi:hypothetical protein OEA41_003379 [Lepraria neglecta]|uniref:Uncharacterized protein n=1 Tax=Lepraria neglecta TaxID=209136 RepID=A0AAE0DJ92_9LECA|nr:hypothetical protein OEA41_003379 [Lepraria neglecta]